MEYINLLIYQSDQQIQVFNYVKLLDRIFTVEEVVQYQNEEFEEDEPILKEEVKSHHLHRKASEPSRKETKVELKKSRTSYHPNDF